MFEMKLVRNPTCGSLVYITPGYGIYLSSLSIWITFDSFTQDILSLLGPCTSFADATHSFLNYFSLGIDFYIDSSSRVSKIILHTNLPGRYDFGKYEKANFCVRELSNQINHEDLTNPLLHLTRIGSSSSACIHSFFLFMQAEEIEQTFEPCLEKIELERSKWLKRNEHFDASIFWLFDGITFEIAPNGYLACVHISRCNHPNKM